jgi:hypothetical protein
MKPAVKGQFGMKMERFFNDWDVFILIMAVGVLTGLIFMMSFNPGPESCHHVLVHAIGRGPATWMCGPP